MKTKINNFLNAIAPLAQTKSDLGELLVMSYLESKWVDNKEVTVSDLLVGIKQYSSASLNRKLKQLKDKKILSVEINADDERVKIIKKGLNYDDYLDEISKSMPNDNAQLS